MEETIWVCGDCGSEEVYEAVWLSVNGTGGGEPVGDGEYFCEDCDNRVYSLIKKNDWEEE